jgi:CheY-like chemotaxis protein
MQVDTEPFPMNMIDFEGKKVLIWPSIADKEKGKEVIIGNTREADERNKVSCTKVVAEKTPDGGETLKVTITTSGTEGQAQTRGQAREPVLRITDSLHPDADGPKLLRTVRNIPADGPASLRTRNDHVHSNHDDLR